MCHLWQFGFGTPSRKSYHNKEWANKMENLGLIPSDTGRPGGKKVGQQMNDYPQKDGVFEKLCIKLFKDGLFIKWFDRFPDEISHTREYEEDEIKEFIENLDEEKILESLYTTVTKVIEGILPVEEVRAMSITKQKTKYLCTSCNSALWGRPNLSIKCNSCNADFIIVN